MRPTRLCALFVPLASLLLAPQARAQDFAVAQSSQPYPEVRYEHRTGADPARRIFIARVDVSDPDVDVRVSPGGPDPDGPGEFQTTLQVLSAIAEREHFEVAVNGDFFSVRPSAPAATAPPSTSGARPAKVLGPAVTDGFLWSPAGEARPSLILDANKSARIEAIREAPADARQVIAGSTILLRDGQAETDSTFSRTRHPRTAVGIADGGKTLILVVVDGRRPNQAIGMSLSELSALMLALGCRDALNLDGGGSSQMVLRDPATGTLQVMNSPSDGRERAVANALGITVRGSRRAPASPVAAAPADAPTPTAH